ncbi:MAG: adenosylcobalamin-dependent ribonucleoside-diphosphate reductase, partial [Patescibacteria group bacterium]
ERPNTQWYCDWKGVKTKPNRVLRAPNGSVTGMEEIDITVKEIFDELVHNAWSNGEPGIVFIDEVNRTNPLPGLGPIDCSNPCGEQFLHHYDNCNLGSINLAAFVSSGKVDPSRRGKAEVDWSALKRSTKIATRLMDNVIDTFDFPVQQVTDLAKKNRRIGLGIMGFADMLYQLGISYHSEEGQKLGEKVMKTITDASHEMSQALAKEKGTFPNLPFSIYAKKKIKMRNAALTTVAPTGSIAMMFDCSSGIEPNFALSFIKQDKDGMKYNYLNKYFEDAMKKARLSEKQMKEVKDEVTATGSIQGLSWLPESLKKTFVVAMDISAEGHMKMQAAFQKNVDNSISKTINFPNSATHEEVFDGYVSAWRLKCKSATVYRDGSRNVQILNIGTGENIKSPTEIGKEGIRTAPVQTTQPQIEISVSLDQLSAGNLVPRERPEVMIGKTYKVKTGYGHLYVTVNNDENGQPFEVFATIGKSGGFFQEQSEGICRLISLALRTGIKSDEVIHNLKGIRGPMPTMTNKGTVLSLPDAIGQILEEHLNSGNSPRTEITESDPVMVNVKESVEQETVSVTTKKSIAYYGMMPGCPDCGGALTLAEGCMSCRSCGFSRCS